MEQGRISGWQFFLLVNTFILGTSIFLRPGELILIAKESAWIPMIWIGTTGAVIACLWFLLANHYPGLSIIQISMKAAGKRLGGLIALLYVCFFIEDASFVIRTLGDFMGGTLLRQTPMTVVHLVMLAISCYAAVKGIETIARANQMLAPIFILTLMIFYLITLSNWDWEHFESVFRINLWKTVKESRSFIGYPYIEAVCFMMVFPYVKSKVKQGMLYGILFSSIIFIIIIFFTIGVLGVTRSSHTVYPFYVIAQELRISTFIEHVEAPVVVIMMIGIFIKLCVVFYCAVLSLCQLFELEDRTWVGLPLVLCISGVTLTLYDNLPEGYRWIERNFFENYFPFGILFPLFFWGMTWWKNKSKRQTKGES